MKFPDLDLFSDDSYLQETARMVLSVRTAAIKMAIESEDPLPYLAAQNIEHYIWTGENPLDAASEEEATEDNPQE